MRFVAMALSAVITVLIIGIISFLTYKFEWFAIIALFLLSAIFGAKYIFYPIVKQKIDKALRKINKYKGSVVDK